MFWVYVLDSQEIERRKREKFKIEFITCAPWRDERKFTDFRYIFLSFSLFSVVSAATENKTKKMGLKL